MNPKHNTDIDILLAKHFADEHLLSSENEQFMEWKQENSQKYAHLKKLIRKTSKTIIVDTDKAWKNILSVKKKTTSK